MMSDLATVFLHQPRSGRHERGLSPPRILDIELRFAVDGLPSRNDVTPAYVPTRSCSRDGEVLNNTFSMVDRANACASLDLNAMCIGEEIEAVPTLFMQYEFQCRQRVRYALQLFLLLASVSFPEEPIAQQPTCTGFGGTVSQETRFLSTTN